MTRIKIPGHWIRNSDVDVNAWFQARGATVIQRDRTSRGHWVITIQETLTPTQQTQVINALTARLNEVQVEVI